MPDSPHRANAARSSLRLHPGSPWLRFATRTALVIALAYAALCGWLYLRQESLIYFPQGTRAVATPPDLAVVTGDTTLRGWRVNPGQSRAVLYFGGNAESVEAQREVFARWLPGANTYLLPYRGYGPNGGTPDEESLYADALSLYDHVHREQPDAMIDVIGRSLGGGVASYLAGQRPVSRLVLVTPFDSLAGIARAHYRWLPVDALLRDRYDSTAHLAGHTGAVLVVRAGRDEIVPAASTDRLIAALPESAHVVTVTGAGHNTLDRFPEYRQAVVAFLTDPNDLTDQPAEQNR